MSDITYVSETLASPTGAALCVYSCVPGAPPKAVIQINHGLAEHAARYERFARFLAGEGFAVYAHDHRGHGATKAKDAPLGSFGKGGAATVIADVLAVHDLIRERHPGVPVLVFGHSMGGLIALNFAETHPDRLAGLAIWNSNFNGGALGRVAQGILKGEAFFKGSDTPSTVLPALTFAAWAKQIKDRRTDFDWLSHDPAEVDAYIADPLCGFDASVGMWQAVFSMIYSGGQSDRLSRLPRDLPIDLVGGAEDPATEGGKAVAWLGARMKAVGMSRVSCRILPGMRHETLNEIGREKEMAALAAFAGTLSL